MESKENSLLRPARCGRCGEFFCFCFWEVVGAGQAGAGRCSVGFRAGAGRGGQCGFRASVGAVFILNGMIFSFLDEKQVFKGVV